MRLDDMLMFRSAGGPLLGRALFFGRLGPHFFACVEPFECVANSLWKTKANDFKLMHVESFLHVVAFAESGLDGNQPTRALKLPT